ncbi:MAG: hypothetical protein FWC75_09450 [Oscillospiraceae bacterium]|nr:hypothetical protein [Oscillospiraceae bacterium]
MIIKNTIQIDDQASAVLKTIKENLKDVYRALEELPEATSEIADWIDLTKAKMSEFADATKEIKEVMSEMADETSQAMEEAAEAIEEVSEAVHGKAEAIDEVSVAIENVGKSSASSARGIQQMTQGVSRMLGAFGLLPRSIGQSVIGVTQLKRGINATTPAAVKLVAALGPITLIATAAMGVASAIRMLRNDTDAAIPSVDQLLGRTASIARESEQLTSAIQANIYEMERLHKLGASAALIDTIRHENYLMETQVQLRRELANFAQAAAAEAAIYAAFTAQQVGHEWIWMPHDFPQRVAVMRSAYQLVREAMDGFSELTAQQQLELGETIVAWQDYIDILHASGDVYEALKLETITQDFVVLTGSIRDTEKAVEAAIRTYISADKQLQLFNDSVERSAAVSRAFGAATQQMRRHVLRSYRDIYSAADSVRSSHMSLTEALNAVNTSYGVTLDQFNEIMTMAPEMLAFLFNEYGALKDVEDAVYELTQAQMDLMLYRQKNALLDMITVLDAEGNIMGVHTNIVDNLANSYRVLFYERTRALAAGVEAGTVTQAEYDAVRNVLSGLGGITASARDTAARGGVRRGADTVGTSRGRAALVSDPANDGIREEIMRLKEDVSRRDYMGGAYQYRPAEVNLSPGAIVVNATPGMNEERLAQLAGQYACSMVAEQLERAFDTDLLRG